MSKFKTKNIMALIIALVAGFAIATLINQNQPTATTAHAEQTTAPTKIKTFSKTGPDKVPTSAVDKQVNKFLQTHDGHIVNAQTTSTKSNKIGEWYNYSYTVTVSYQ